MKFTNRTAFDARPLRRDLDRIARELGSEPNEVFLDHGTETSKPRSIASDRKRSLSIFVPRGPRVVFLHGEVHELALAFAVAAREPDVERAAAAAVGAGLSIIELIASDKESALRRAGLASDAREARPSRSAARRVAEIVAKLAAIEAGPQTPASRRTRGRLAALLSFWNRRIPGRKAAP